MLSALRDFLTDLAGAPAQAAFDPADPRLATAALLISVISVDDEEHPAEFRRLRAVLADAYGLTPEETEELIAAARQSEEDAVDLYAFTARLKRALDEDGRRAVIGMMWEIVYADGTVSEFEENMIWRVAELLGISSRDRLALKRSVESRA